MARSRNIKPGFFTNDVLAEVHPLGRLLFIALWTMADREGRLEDRPKRIKAEALPYDECDADVLLTDLQEHGFITRYEASGQRFIQILAFAKHQNPHVKEPPSSIPAPDMSGASTVQAPDKTGSGRADSGFLIPDSPSLIPVESAAPAKPARSPSGSRIPDGFPADPEFEWCRQERPELDPRRVGANFRDHWLAKPGKDGRKSDWPATWRTWVRRENGPPSRASPPASRHSATIAALTGRANPSQEYVDVESRTIPTLAAGNG